jgi:hypothetical protein
VGGLGATVGGSVGETETVGEIETDGLVVGLDLHAPNPTQEIDPSIHSMKALILVLTPGTPPNPEQSVEKYEEIPTKTSFLGESPAMTNGPPV